MIIICYTKYLNMEAKLKIVNNVLELLIRLCLRQSMGKAGYFIVFTGAGLISPSLIVEIINLLLAKGEFGQLPAPESMPVLGTLLLLVGVGLILINYFWSPRCRHKEVIGLRHNSLGSFPQEDVRKDLPLLQRLQSYREVDVDHSDSYSEGILEDHQSVIRRLDRVPHELRGLLGSAPDSHIAYYGLPHVPLAFYLGYRLSDNKYKVDLYDLNNQSHRWNQLSGKDDRLELDTTLDKMPASNDTGDIVLTIGISYRVQESEIAELGLRSVLATVEINARNPQRQLISNQSQIDQVCREFRRGLELVKNNFPNRQRIHMFYAGPVSLCFALGRCISERIDPEIVVYNYSSKTTPRYSWSLSLNSPHHASAAFHSTVPTGGTDVSVQYAQ